LLSHAGREIGNKGLAPERTCRTAPAAARPAPSEGRGPGSAPAALPSRLPPAQHQVPARPHWAMAKGTLAVTALARAAFPQLGVKPGRTETSWKREENSEFQTTTLDLLRGWMEPQTQTRVSRKAVSRARPRGPGSARASRREARLLTAKILSSRPWSQIPVLPIYPARTRGQQRSQAHGSAWRMSLSKGALRLCIKIQQEAGKGQ